MPSEPYEAVIDILRMRLDLEPDDPSHDDRIAKYSAEKVLRELCAWNLGDPGWASTMLRWASIAGYKMEAPDAE